MQNIYYPHKKFIYKVKNGETLKDISEKFEVPEVLIKRINGFTEIYCGCILVIPFETFNIHKVMPNETLAQIARKYGVKEGSIQKANDDRKLRTGMSLIIPKE